MTLFTGIDHVQLAAPPDSEEKARHFFHTILGMPEIPKPEDLAKRGGVWFDCGGLEVHIGVEEPFSPARKAHPALRVHNLELARERLQEFNWPVKPEQPLNGSPRFYTEDPFGNRLELIER
ncbi:VOC family protein [Marinococcus luteus]|uniref:VOC family protein n=1 Tax=Marinococcus luteus TaxID=1122204 RepID=UPI002ACC9E33|nr:VOC family protein [Marinococcus luteus]MDZ5782792.1 VOC family protein [Marinococcus luteus]